MRRRQLLQLAVASVLPTPLPTPDYALSIKRFVDVTISMNQCMILPGAIHKLSVMLKVKQ